MEHPIQYFTKGRFSHMIHDIKSLYFSNWDQIRISSIVYEELRYIITTYLDDIFKQLVPLKNFQKNNLVTEKDILQILHFVPGMIPRLKHCSNHKLDKISYSNKFRYEQIRIELGKLDKKKNKFSFTFKQTKDDKILQQINELKKKIQSLREEQSEINYEHFEPAREKRMELQEKLKEQNSCFYFYPKAVRKLIDYLVPDYKFTFTDDAYLLLQFDLEYFLKQLLRNSIKTIFYHSNRETLMIKDIHLSKATMAAYEKIIPRPRFVYPENNVSYKAEYIKIRDAMKIEEKTVNTNLILQLDRFNHLLIELLVQYAHFYSVMEKSSTITKHSLESAVKSIIQGDLLEYSLKEGTKSKELFFNIKTPFRLEADAAVILNRIVEYINAEIIGLMNGLNSISSFYSILHDDEELNNLTNHLGFVVIKMT
jgi:histone H3/H4